MSPPRGNERATASAEEEYRKAFERLKNRAPINLPLRSAVSQKNVALEAGKEESALKRSRFPDLVAEIKRYVEDHASNKQKRDELSAANAKIEKLQSQLTQAIELRDEALSKLHIAELLILDLRKDCAPDGPIGSS